MKRKHAGQIEIPLPGAIGFAHDPDEAFAAEYGRDKMEAELAAYIAERACTCGSPKPGRGAAHGTRRGARALGDGSSTLYHPSVSFVPASSIAPATVTVGGTVAVSSVAGTVLTDSSAHTQPVSGAVSVSNFPATQPVSGTVAVSAVAGSVTVTGPLTDTQLRASAVPISAASLPLPSGAATAAAQTDGTQRVGGTVTTDGSGHTQPVSGAVTVSGTATVSGTVTANQGTAAGTAWPVDASGVAVPVTGPLTNTQLRAAAISVDGSAVTQPVSAASLPLPAGAATEVTLVEAKRSLDDVGLTAILQRETLEAA